MNRSIILPSHTGTVTLRSGSFVRRGTRISTVAQRELIADVVARADADLAITVLRRTRAGMANLGTPILAVRTPALGTPALGTPVLPAQRTERRGFGVLTMVALIALITLWGACSAGWLTLTHKMGATPALVQPAIQVDAITGGTVGALGQHPSRAWAGIH